MEACIKKALDDLKKSLGKIKSLAEWVNVKRQENRILDPFQIVPEDTVADLEMEIWKFLSLMHEVEALTHRDDKAQMELSHLMREFHQVKVSTAL